MTTLYRVRGGESLSVHPGTGWIGGQFLLRGRPAWLVDASDDRARVACWDGDVLDVAVTETRQITIEEPPMHGVLAEHLMMAGWYRVGPVKPKGKGGWHMRGQSPSGRDYRFTGPDGLPDWDRVTVTTADGDDVTTMNAPTLDRIVRWLRTEQKGD